MLSTSGILRERRAESAGVREGELHERGGEEAIDRKTTRQTENRLAPFSFDNDLIEEICHFMLAA
jgi:hypothetical protein